MLTPVTRAPSWIALCFGLVLLAGSLLRLAGLNRPVGVGTPSPWREGDLTQVARSFHLEDQNPFHPRVYWRGATNGEVEMELPVLSWIAGRLYTALGERVWILRGLSALTSVLALFAFRRLAARSLDPPGALLATALFAFSSLPLVVASSIQPESLELLLLIAAVGAISGWRESGRDRDLYAACAWTAAAILVKAPAAHLGFLLAWCVLRRHGLRALRLPSVLLGAALALVPPLAWYTWAHSLYLDTGLSLGVSNETHLLSGILLQHPRTWVMGNLEVELRDVYSFVGLPLAACAFLRSRRVIEPAVAWVASLALFYVVIADTSGDEWATYYHVISAPAACLLMAHGCVGLAERLRARGAPETVRALRWAPLLAGALAVVAVGGRGLYARAEMLGTDTFEEMRRCATELAAHVPLGARIAVSGGTNHDWHGHPVAYNESMVFTWMDRKGFSFALEERGVDGLRLLAAQGADYWFAKPSDFTEETGLEQGENTFPLVASCGRFRLRALRPPAR